MVRAMLEGRKTQTRRIIKPQPSAFKGGINPRNIGKPNLKPAPYFDCYRNARRTQGNPEGMSQHWCWWTEDDRQGPDWIKCPYGQPGDRLWVRETWAPTEWPNPNNYAYRSDLAGDEAETFYRWHPSIHMPRWASRILLEIVSVRVERLQDISEADAKAEGVLPYYCAASKLDTYGPDHAICGCDHRAGFCRVWRDLHDIESWDASPWVWVVEFKRVEA